MWVTIGPCVGEKNGGNFIFPEARMVGINEIKCDDGENRQGAIPYKYGFYHPQQLERAKIGSKGNEMPLVRGKRTEDGRVTL